MRKLCKILAVIMSLVLSFGILLPCYAETTEKPENHISDIYEEAVDSFLIAKFYRFCNAFDFIFSTLVGNENIFSATDSFKVVIKGQLEELCKNVSNNSSLDLFGIITNFPDISAPARVVAEKYNIDPATFRTEMYALSEQYKAEGNDLLASITAFIGAYFSVIKECSLEIATPKNSNTPEIKLVVTYSDGGTEEFFPGILVDPKTGLFYGKDNKGMLQFGFNFSMYDMLVTAPVNCWMRSVGFCVTYDIAAYITPIYAYETHRYFFDYDGKEWMIQMWKGDYIMATGGEVGIYNRDPEKAMGSFYNCSEELFDMSLQISHGETTTLVSVNQQHWWINGFKVVNETKYPPNELTMTCSIVMEKGMLDAFCKSIDSSRLIYNDVTYYTNPDSEQTDKYIITFTWDGPDEVEQA